MLGVFVRVPRVEAVVDAVRAWQSCLDAARGLRRGWLCMRQLHTSTLALFGTVVAWMYWASVGPNIAASVRRDSTCGTLLAREVLPSGVVKRSFGHCGPGALAIMRSTTLLLTYTAFEIVPMLLRAVSRNCAVLRF